MIAAARLWLAGCKCDEFAVSHRENAWLFSASLPYCKWLNNSGSTNWYADLFVSLRQKRRPGSLLGLNSSLHLLLILTPRHRCSFRLSFNLNYSNPGSSSSNISVGSPYGSKAASFTTVDSPPPSWRCKDGLVYRTPLQNQRGPPAHILHDVEVSTVVMVLDVPLPKILASSRHSGLEESWSLWTLKCTEPTGVLTAFIKKNS